MTERKISVVIPCHNEVGNVSRLFEEIHEKLSDSLLEVIFVDDGSADGTADVLRDLAASHERALGVKLTRNFGHQAAILAGINKAKGAAVIVMDADFQHPPAVANELIAKWQEGYTVVRAVRLNTADASSSKKLFSAAFYRLLNNISEVRIDPSTPDFYLLDRKCVEEIKSLSGHYLFMRGIIFWLGYDYANIKFESPKRAQGETSYGFKKNAALVVSAMTTMSRAPLRFGIYLGASIAVLSFLFFMWSLVAWARDDVIVGWTSLVTLITFIGATQLFLLGIIGEYIGMVFDRTRGLPPFVIDKEY